MGQCPGGDSTRENGLELKERKFILEVRGNFFTERVEQCWHKLHSEAMDVPFMEVFKARLDGARC